MYWTLALGLFLLGFVLIQIFDFLFIPLRLFFSICDVTLANGNQLTIPTSVISLVVISIYRLYILCGWAALCASLTLKCSHTPEASNAWLCYSIGFILCIGLLGYIALTECWRSRVTWMEKMFAAVYFIFVCIQPQIFSIPYNWFLVWFVSRFQMVSFF